MPETSTVLLASVNRDITSSGRKGVERERGEWPVFNDANASIYFSALCSRH
jgi:hypothetical protein